MSYLVYCVLRADEPARARRPSTSSGRPEPAEGRLRGVDGAEVFLFPADGLAAAVSRAPEACAAPSLQQAAAFARVVEAFHASGTVLPVRYGCHVASVAELVALLRERCAELLASLHEVEGCAEMGIRILLPKAGALLRQGYGGPPARSDAMTGVAPIADWGMRIAECGLRNAGSGGSESAIPNPQSPGRAYLAGRRTCYEARDGQGAEAAAVAERIRQELDGLFVRLRVECSPAGDRRLLSLHFLVRRRHVAAFRAAFGRLQGQRAEKVLLTGPWPPYNFAAGAKGPQERRALSDTERSSQCGMASMEAIGKSPLCAGEAPQTVSPNPRRRMGMHESQAAFRPLA